MLPAVCCDLSESALAPAPVATMLALERARRYYRKLEPA
jgi:hypothetical protein